jgi:hypothetical protein
VHNIRIERLWVDVTAQVGAFWADIFTQLQLQHGLDANNIYHIWLLHHLFLHIINQQLAFFAEAWNQHRIQIRNGPNRSPADLFGFDMFVHGVRGHRLSDEDDAGLGEAEMEIYGVDWEALRDDHLLHSQRENNPSDEGWSSWVGHVGPPENLNEVSVSPPSGFLQEHKVDALDHILCPWRDSPDESDIISLWVTALNYCQTLRNAFI